MSLSESDRKPWIAFLRSTARPDAREASSTSAALSRDLSLLSLLHLAGKLDGDDFVSLADTVLQSVVLPSLSVASGLTAEQAKLLSSSSLQDTLKASPHTQQLATLYKEAGTEQSAQLLVHYLLIQLVRNAAVPAFDTFLTSQVSAEVAHAKVLLGALYSLVNTSPLPAALPKLLLQILLVKIGDASLPFLASIWTNATALYSAAVSLAALRHADAYLHAQAQASAHHEPKDFQVVVPLLLVALSDAEAAIRLAAISCLERVLKISKQATDVSKASKKKGKEVDIFGFESFYGAAASSELQYVDLASLVYYLEQLLERKSSFRNDAAVLPQLHGELLQVGRQDGRKEIGHKHAIVCFTLSHILSSDSLATRLVLLQMLAPVSDASKLQMLLPLIRTVVEGNATAVTKALRAADDRELYLELLFASYDQSCVPLLRISPRVHGRSTSRLLLARMASDSSRKRLCAHSTKPVSLLRSRQLCDKRATCTWQASSLTQLCLPRPKSLLLCASSRWILPFSSLYLPSFARPSLPKRSAVPRPSVPALRLVPTRR